MAPTRRAYLAGVGGTAAGLAGCTGGGTEPVSVLAAGSLQHFLSSTFTGRVDAPVEAEAHGSATVARLVASGRRDPDVVALADTGLFEALDPPFHAAFATNALALAYDSDSAVGKRLAAGERWFEPLSDAPASLGRTDPDLDPLGYRTLFALQLAAARHDRPELLDLPRRDQIHPETALLSAFETGAVDAAVVYRSMARERDYPAVDLPAAVDLSDPARADAYAGASYTLPEGRVVRGDVIEYGASLRHDRPAARSVFAALARGEGLSDHGFVLPSPYPDYRGDVPESLT
jgi:molybdate/tungstate transport system substrate-binding protein